MLASAVRSGFSYLVKIKKKIKYILYLRYYAEACIEWWGPSNPAFPKLWYAKDLQVVRLKIQKLLYFFINIDECRAKFT